MQTNALHLKKNLATLLETMEQFEIVVFSLILILFATYVSFRNDGTCRQVDPFTPLPVTDNRTGKPPTFVVATSPFTRFKRAPAKKVFSISGGEKTMEEALKTCDKTPSCYVTQCVTQGNKTTCTGYAADSKATVTIVPPSMDPKAITSTLYFKTTARYDI